MSKLDPTLTVREVMEVFRISRQTLYRWRKEKKIRAIKKKGPDRLVRFSRIEVLRVAEEKEVILTKGDRND